VLPVPEQMPIADRQDRGTDIGPPEPSKYEVIITERVPVPTTDAESEPVAEVFEPAPPPKPQVVAEEALSPAGEKPAEPAEDVAVVVPAAVLGIAETTPLYEPTPLVIPEVVFSEVPTDAAEADSLEPTDDVAEDAVAIVESLDETVEGTPDIVAETLPVVFQEFIDTLSVVVHEHETPVGEANEPLTVESSPAVVITVAERLRQLDEPEQTAVEPLLRDITAMVRTVQVLQVQEEIPAEAEAAAYEQLAQLVQQLCVELDVVYEPEDVQAFVRVLLQPVPTDIVIETEAVPAVDLEHDGTREAKWRQLMHTDGLGQLPHRLGRIVGAFVLRSSVIKISQAA